MKLTINRLSNKNVVEISDKGKYLGDVIYSEGEYFFKADELHLSNGYPTFKSAVVGMVKFLGGAK